MLPLSICLPLNYLLSPRLLSLSSRVLGGLSAKLVEGWKKHSHPALLARVALSDLSPVYMLPEDISSANTTLCKNVWLVCAGPWI